MARDGPGEAHVVRRRTSPRCIGVRQLCLGLPTWGALVARRAARTPAAPPYCSPRGGAPGAPEDAVTRPVLRLRGADRGAARCLLKQVRGTIGLGPATWDCLEVHRPPSHPSTFLDGQLHPHCFRRMPRATLPAVGSHALWALKRRRAAAGCDVTAFIRVWWRRGHVRYRSAGHLVPACGSEANRML